MPYTEWVNGEPIERLTPEERKEKKRLAKEAKLEKKKRVPGQVPKYIKGKKEGMDLENRVTNKWNASFDSPKTKKANVKQRLSLETVVDEEEDEPVDEGYTLPPLSAIKKGVPAKPHFSKRAKRQPNSGAMWHAKGDVTLSHALLEVKERGTINGRGEKTISIPKEWLTKQADEAFQERRDYWYLVFAYKGDDEIYVIKPYDHEIELIKKIEALEDELKKYKQ